MHCKPNKIISYFLLCFINLIVLQKSSIGQVDNRLFVTDINELKGKKYVLIRPETIKELDDYEFDKIQNSRLSYPLEPNDTFNTRIVTSSYLLDPFVKTNLPDTLILYNRYFSYIGKAIFKQFEVDPAPGLENNPIVIARYLLIGNPSGFDICKYAISYKSTIRITGDVKLFTENSSEDYNENYFVKQNQYEFQIRGKPYSIVININEDTDINGESIYRSVVNEISNGVEQKILETTNFRSLYDLTLMPVFVNEKPIYIFGTGIPNSCDVGESLIMYYKNGQLFKYGSIKIIDW